LKEAYILPSRMLFNFLLDLEKKFYSISDTPFPYWIKKARIQNPTFNKNRMIVSLNNWWETSVSKKQGTSDASLSKERSVILKHLTYQYVFLCLCELVIWLRNNCHVLLHSIISIISENEILIFKKILSFNFQYDQNW